MSDVYTEMGQNPDSKITSSDTEHPVGEMVSGMWVVSGEDMPALSAYQEAKGDYIIAGGILGKQEKRITYAHPKHLKTMLEIWKGMCIATGTPFFGYQVKQGRVLYVGMEDTLPKLSNRVEKMKQHFPPIDEFKFTVLPIDKRILLAIEALIIQLKPDVVMIDPLTNLLKREDKKEDVESLLKGLDQQIEKYGISLILIHHARKGHGETLESMRGSSALTGWADTICRIDRRGNNKYKIKLDFECRHAAEEVEPINLNFRIEDCYFEEDTTLAGELQKEIRQELATAGGQMPLSVIKDKLEDKASSRTIERAINGMPDVIEEFDATDKRKRILRLNLEHAVSIYHLQD